MSQSRRGFFGVVAGLFATPFAAVAAPIPPTATEWAAGAAARAARNPSLDDIFDQTKMVVLKDFAADASAYFTKLETSITWPNGPFCPALSEAG